MKAVLVAIDVVDVAPGFDPEFTDQKVSVLVPFSHDLGRVVKMTTVLELLQESLAVLAKEPDAKVLRLSDLFKKSFA